MTALPADVALLVIDLQPDFMPGGALACDQGDALVAPIAELLAQRRYRTVVATQDWHPADHASFASQHPGTRPFESILLHAQPQTLWPDHCVQGSDGAALHPGVDWNVADLILHEVTLEPVRDVARCFIGATLGQGTVQTQLQHLRHLVVIAAGCCRHIFGDIALLRHQIFDGALYQTFTFILLFCQQIFNGAVQRQIRVAANWRSKVRIR